MKLLQDTWLLFTHNLKLSLRNPMVIIVGLLQPITWLFLFAPLLNNVPFATGASVGNALEAFTPGLLMLLVPTGSLFAGIGLIAEMRAGLIERMRVTPISRLALVLGRALRDLTILFSQAVLLLIIALPMGLRANIGGVAAGLVLLLLVGLLMTSCSYAMALALQNENAVASVANMLILPLMLLSGVFLPLTLAPGWLRAIAALNPMAYSVDALRALFQGSFGDTSVVFGFGLMLVLSALALTWATRSFHQVSA